MESFLDYARRGKHDWWRYLIATPAALLLATIGGVAIGLALLQTGVMTAETLQDALTSPAVPARFFAATGVTFALIMAAFAAMIALIHRKRPLDVLGRWSWKQYAIGVAVWAVVLVVLTLVDYALSPSSFSLDHGGKSLTIAGWMLAGLFVQTLAEEYIFRGYVTQGLLLAFKNPWVTAAVSGLVFGAVHIPNGLPQAVAATGLGAGLALIAIRTGGLAWGAGLHLINNLFGALIVVSATDVFNGSPAFIRQNSPQLMWWDTVAVWLAALLTAAAVEIWSRRRRA